MTAMQRARVDVFCLSCKYGKRVDRSRRQKAPSGVMTVYHHNANLFEDEHKITQIRLAIATGQALSCQLTRER